MVVPIPIAMPSTAAMIGLTLWASEYRNFAALEARGVSVLEVPSARKSSRSLPAVNTPEPPVMIMQRIFGLFCAVSIASLIARYISWVIAFLFSGRRSVITRVVSSSVTIRCPVMAAVPGTGGDGAAGESLPYILHDILHDPGKGPNRRACFRRKSSWE